MSINGAMLAGIAGLRANASALGAISTNIANVNTVGYKSSQASFQTFLSASTSSGSYSPGGVAAIIRQSVDVSAPLQQSASGLDLGINGQGFFVTTQKPDGLTDSDTRLFTRAGSFTIDDNGYLRNASGLYLQGWMADPNTKEITPNPSDLAKMSTMRVNNVGGTSAQTNKVGLNANLDGRIDAVGAANTALRATEALALDAMSDYAADPLTGAKPDASIPFSVYDSQGGKQGFSLNLLKASDAPNKWYAEVRAADGVPVATPPGPVVASGVVAFNTDGTINMAGTTPGLSALNISWAASSGLAPQAVALELNQTPGGLSQKRDATDIQSVTNDGTPFGSLAGVGVDEDGFVIASYNNGVSERIGQVALATFPNPNALEAVSGTAWGLSTESGSFNLKVPGTGGSGKLSPFTLEASTVDLSAEFTNLITTQRAYSASSKIITTADQMLEELLTIKR
jgi:flagellar hook protein FlgE